MSLYVADLDRPLADLSVAMVVVETDQERLVVDVHNVDGLVAVTRYALPGQKRRPWDGDPLVAKWIFDPVPGRRWRHKVAEPLDGPFSLRISGEVRAVRVMPGF